ncbi:gastrula zinc finger protein xFG20-1-like isoform X2 [Sitodiplosis mosellana]|uniref:gastrula zinc finger protein xFG20-1-like isoform X2 n=1 Tax=Sitodiplosis mosellana TaxID=263140 RepID=UPI002443EF75|nr:gastrula zinc finger protein xFG20-1-like isoform X2 [Sitodiplosis mosellana]
MTKEVCFICNTESDDLWKMNEVSSQHTNTPIVELLKEILGVFDIKRTIDCESNCICSDCFNRLEEYDWACDIAKKREKDISDTFLKTETLYPKLGESKTIENVSKKIDSSVDLLPKVEAGRILSFEFRSTTIRKITIDKTQIKCDPPERNVIGESKEVVDIVDDSSGHEQEYDMDMDMDSGSDFECTPNKTSTSSISKEIVVPTTSRSNPRKRRKKNTGADDNESSNEDELPTPKNRHECLYCGQAFARKSDYITHVRWHKKQQKPRFSCDMCSFVLDDQASFDAHKKLHENTPKLECVICNRVVSTRGNLTAHMRVHGTPNHICHICGKEFIHNTSFDAHMKFHDNSRLFSCQQCPMKFNIATNLKNHMQTHRQHKPYACKICGSRFGYLGNMRAHEKTHSSTEKSHKCSVCDAQFATQSKMIQHMDKLHSTSVLHKKEKRKRSHVYNFVSPTNECDQNE